MQATGRQAAGRSFNPCGREFGDADVLHIENVALPKPASGEVRLRIHAIGINRTEITLRAGNSAARPAFPTGLGFEASGVIEALGPDVAGFSIGDRVALVPAYGAAQYPLYGEVSVAPARSLVAIPAHVSFTQAADTWAAYGTAWAGLVGIGALRKGQNVLISAASSSVGVAAIQIANLLGARPIALTRTSAKANALRSLGTADVVATAEQDVVEEVQALTGGKGAELVFDPVGGPGFATLAKATAAGGMLLLYGALDRRPTIIPNIDIFARHLTVRGVSLTSASRNDAKLEVLKQFIAAGIADGPLQPVIAATFAFEQITEAHRFMESGGQLGKIVVTIN